MYKFYVNVIKRALDTLVALFSSIILSPVLLIIAIAIRAESKGPVLFKQQRLGKAQKPFTIYKFRSMVVGAEDLGEKRTLPNDWRITRIGAILRKTSLDEVPQFFNILKGDMSLIGPRPDLEGFAYRDYAIYSERFRVLPGVTGLAQVSGRSNITPEQRERLDAEYAQNVSLGLDLKIFAKTVKKVIKMESTT